MAAAVHGLVYVPFVHRHVTTDTDAYVAAAHALEHARYTTPLRASFYYTYPVGFFDLTGVPEGRGSAVFRAPEKQAFRTPGYPLALALVGGGGPGGSRYAVLVLQAVLLGLATWLLALIVRRWWGPATALLAEAIYALDPYSKHYVTLVVTETLATVVAVTCVYAFTRAWQERTPSWWAATGALASALTLVRPVFVVAVPLVAVAATLRPSQRVRRGLAAVLAVGLLLVPWLAWTDHVTGKPVLSNWGEGFNLLLAAHGERLGHEAAEIESERSFAAELAASRRMAPTTRQLLADPFVHPRYLRHADAQLRTQARSLYWRRLKHRPLEVVWENLYRNYFLWTAHHDWYQPSGVQLLALQTLDWILLLLAGAGIVLALRRRGAAAAVAVFLVLYSITLSTHHVEARFSMPLRGFFLAYVAFALAELARGRRLTTSRVA
ncbi:MAG: glycosyltransferase family 39 protein [Actinobacteria bacterium]|nr:MAG: glycosyltransferase family 39 protein [Actinomycetota bacterium]